MFGSLVVMPLVGITGVALLGLLTPERSWPPDEDEDFALCVVYVAPDGDLAARYPSRGHTPDTFQESLAELYESGATFILPESLDAVPHDWPGTGQFSYHIVSVSNDGVQLVRARCQLHSGELYKTTYQVAGTRLDPVSYLMGYGWFTTTWRVVLVLVLVTAPLFWLGGRAERRHEERRSTHRRTY